MAPDVDTVEALYALQGHTNTILIRRAPRMSAAYVLTVSPFTLARRMPTEQIEDTGFVTIITIDTIGDLIDTIAENDSTNDTIDTTIENPIRRAAESSRKRRRRD